MYKPVKGKWMSDKNVRHFLENKQMHTRLLKYASTEKRNARTLELN